MAKTATKQEAKPRTHGYELWYHSADSAPRSDIAWWRDKTMTKEAPARVEYACHICQEPCDCDRCRLNRAAPDLLAALTKADTLLAILADLVEMHGGRCDSCGCTVEPTAGYCGCAPMRDTVLYERRCRARVAMLEDN